MAIREVAHAFHTAKRPEEFFQFALERVSPLVGAAFACVFAIDSATQGDTESMRRMTAAIVVLSSALGSFLMAASAFS